MNHELKVIINAVDNASAKLKAVSASVTKVGQDIKQTGQTLTAGLTLPIVALGGLAAKTFIDFEGQMNRVKGVTGATNEELENMSQLAKEMGRTTVFTATQAADAMGFLAMAGFNVQETMGALPGTLQLAAAAQMDLADAADITSNILTGYGFKTEELGRVNDVLVKTFTNANTNLVQLGEAMKYAGPVANAAGVAFEEAAAAVGLMGNAGIQASMAGTALRGGIARILSPTKQVSEALGELGINVADLQDGNGGLRPLADVIQILGEKGATAGQLMEIFGLRAGPAFTALIEGGHEALREFTVELENAGGTASRIQEDSMAGLYGSFIRLKSALEGVALTIGERMAPVLFSLAEKIQALTRWFQGLSPKIQENAIIAAVAVAALGPLLIIIGGLTIAIGALLTPLGLIVGLLGVGLPVAAVYVVRNFEELRDKLYAFRDALLANTIVQFFILQLERLAAVVTEHLWPAIVRVWESFQPFVPFWTLMAKIAGGILLAAIMVLIEVLTRIAQVVGWVVTAFSHLVAFWNDSLAGSIKATIDFFKELVEWVQKAIDKIKALNVLEGAKKFFNKITGKRADGGPVQPGRSFLVGENGPEVFTPNTYGRINNSVGGGGTTIVLTGNTFMGKEGVARMIGNELMRDLTLREKLQF